MSNVRMLRQANAYTPTQNVRAQVGYASPLPVIDPRDWQGKAVPERQWFVEGWIPVCTENLNPNVVVMKSAQDGVRTYDAGSLDQTRDRRILVQRPMRSNAVVIGRIVFQNAAQMHLAQDNGMVQTFPPDRSDQPFRKAILPR
jgi:hypothetical protein